MVYKALADGVVVVHFFWIVFLAAGAFWGRRNRVVKAVHIAGLAMAVVIQVFQWYCPLTHLEVWLREKHDPSLAYPGSFISHYAEKIVYVEFSPEVIFVLTALIIGMSALLYLRRPPNPARGA